MNLQADLSPVASVHVLSALSARHLDAQRDLHQLSYGMRSDRGRRSRERLSEKPRGPSLQQEPGHCSVRSRRIAGGARQARAYRSRTNLVTKVLDFVQSGGPKWIVGGTIFEMWLGGL